MKRSMTDDRDVTPVTKTLGIFYIHIPQLMDSTVFRNLSTAIVSLSLRLLRFLDPLVSGLTIKQFSHPHPHC